MSKSLIQTYNQSTQNLTEGSTISLGSVLRRYGCDLKLSGNAIEITGKGGYYEISGTITLAPTATGNVTVAAYLDGVQIPSAVATQTIGTANDVVTLPITTTIRKGCNCDGASQLTLVLVDGASAVSNVSLRVEKS